MTIHQTAWIISAASALLIVGLLLFAFGRTQAARCAKTSVGLLLVSIGGFAWLVIALPRAAGSPVRSSVVFLTILIFFRLLSRFEQPGTGKGSGRGGRKLL